MKKLKKYIKINYTIFKNFHTFIIFVFFDRKLSSSLNFRINVCKKKYKKREKQLFYFSYLLTFVSSDSKK